jgi:uncharacterized protein YjbJ (UPF0337 family)
MGYTDKASNEAQQFKGKAKQWVGDQTDDERLEAEGVRAGGRWHEAGR